MEDKNIYSNSGRMDYGDGFSDDDAPIYPQQDSSRTPMQPGGGHGQQHRGAD